MTNLEEGRRHELAQVLGEVARSLQAEQDENHTLSGIVTAAVATVPGVVAGGISQVHRGRITAQMRPAAVQRQRPRRHSNPNRRGLDPPSVRTLLTSPAPVWTTPQASRNA